MENSIISEGKTTNEAIENGLKELNVSKNMVDIKVLENEEKRSFFSILSPRIVKVKLTLKEDNIKEKNIDRERKEIQLTEEEQEKANENINTFLNKFFNNLNLKDMNYEIKKSSTGLNVNISNKDLGFLIGYRGETLYAFQNLLSSIASRGIKNKVRVILDIEGYK